MGRARTLRRSTSDQSFLRSHACRTCTIRRLRHIPDRTTPGILFLGFLPSLGTETLPKTLSLMSCMELVHAQHSPMSPRPLYLLTLYPRSNLYPISALPPAIDFIMKHRHRGQGCPWLMTQTSGECIRLAFWPLFAEENGVYFNKSFVMPILKVTLHS